MAAVYSVFFSVLRILGDGLWHSSSVISKIVRIVQVSF